MLTVMGGMPVGEDGRVHTTFLHNPSTLRLSSTDPNMQNIPRAGKGIERWVKECFIAPPGKVFWEVDYSAIEARLVGYFAGSARYTRFAALGVHAFLASHIASCPANLDDSDDTLRAFFKELKKEHPDAYATAKRVVHGSNYMMGPGLMVDLYPDTFHSQKDAIALQSLYFDLFPEIREWQKNLCLSVDAARRRRKDVEAGEIIEDPWTLGVAYARNPFGYVHRFYNVLDWTKAEGEWHWEYGQDAKRLVAFLPQSTASAILKKAARALFNIHSVADQLRLMIHDSILGECDEEVAADSVRIVEEVMQQPIEELPLDPAWNMGTHLTIGTEAKIGRVWADME